jgi:hypothetical protein
MKAKFAWISLLAVVLSTIACKKDVDDRDAFVGTYNMEDRYTIAGQSVTESFSMSITKSSSSKDRILMTNFGNGQGVTIEATVSGTSLNIPQQTITFDGDNYGIAGSGRIDGNRLTYSYTLSDLTLSLSIQSSGNKL